MSDVEADRVSARDYPQNATGPLFGSTVDLILTNYARREISPNLSYVVERGEGKTKGGMGSTRTDWVLSACAIVWRVFHPSLTTAGWPTSVCNG
jgi:hypothetical protein